MHLVADFNLNLEWNSICSGARRDAGKTPIALPAKAATSAPGDAPTTVVSGPLYRLVRPLHFSLLKLFSKHFLVPYEQNIEKMSDKLVERIPCEARRPLSHNESNCTSVETNEYFMRQRTFCQPYCGR
jgi:hypothetical protein